MIIELDISLLILIIPVNLKLIYCWGWFIMVEKSSGAEKSTGIGDKVRTTISGATDSSMMNNVGEKVSGVGEKLKGTVKGVPKSTDTLSNKIDLFLDDKSDQLIKDWELATKEDIIDIEKRYTKISRDMGKLDSRFNEYRGFTGKNIKKIEDRLDRLENNE